MKIVDCVAAERPAPTAAQYRQTASNNVSAAIEEAGLSSGAEQPARTSRSQVHPSGTVLRKIEEMPSHAVVH